VTPRALVRLGGAVLLAALAAPAAPTGNAGAQDLWDLPPRIAPPRVPADFPMTPVRVELGRHLFYDTRLSGNGTQSCATCHIQALAFTDGRPHGIGSTGEAHARSAMSLVNVAYRDTLTWGHPAQPSLETQVLVPLFGAAPVELGLAGHEARVYADLAADPTYQRLFAAAFAGDADAVTTTNVAAALAAFQRSIVSFRSPFDRFREYEDDGALLPAARRGMVLFFSERGARCANCHRGPNLDGGVKTTATPSDEAPVFTFHQTGLYNLPGRFSYPDDNLGLFAHTAQPQDVGRFRVPTLRNIALTAPYMHDGSIATLDEVLDHYVAGGRTANPARSTGLGPLQLTAADRADLLAFLDSLTDAPLLDDPRWSDPWPSAGR
jgi:cytochrome c peroxidase